MMDIDGRKIRVWLGVVQIKFPITAATLPSNGARGTIGDQHKSRGVEIWTYPQGFGQLEDVR